MWQVRLRWYFINNVDCSRLISSCLTCLFSANISIRLSPIFTVRYEMRANVGHADDICVYMKRWSAYCIWPKAPAYWKVRFHKGPKIILSIALEVFKVYLWCHKRVHSNFLSEHWDKYQVLSFCSALFLSTAGFAFNSCFSSTWQSFNQWKPLRSGEISRWPQPIIFSLNATSPN